MNKRFKDFFICNKFCLSHLWQASKGMLLLYLFTQLVMQTIGLVQLYLFNLLLDKLAGINGVETSLITLAVVYVLTIILQTAASNGQDLTKNYIKRKSDYLFDLKMQEKLIFLPLEIIDTSEGRDMIDRVKYCRNTVFGYLYSFTFIITNAYTMLVALVIMIKFNLLFSVLFIVLCIPGILIEKVFEYKYDKFRNDNAPSLRKLLYYCWMLTDVQPAKDIRMYDLTEPLKERYTEEKTDYLTKNKKLDKDKTIWTILYETIRQSGLIVFTFFVISQAINGNITVGKIAYYTGLASTVSTSFFTCASRMTYLFTYFIISIYRVIDFLELQQEDKGAGIRELHQFESLEFRHVKFKYPKAEVYTLNDVSFKLEKGDKLSIVGINGAGKSTIIKLMLGTYRIESGQILINGYPMQEYSLKDVRRHFSALFQTFVNYSLTLRESVALSDVDRIEDTAEIIKALKLSGIYEKCEAFEDGLETMMTRRFDDRGVEFSKGQWQKLSLARAYFKNAEVIIFDEPSSALDAEAEDRIFNNFTDISDGKTSIMISHRISSSKLSNKVIVLNNGVIEENGTHDQLLTNNGLYAKLYKLQQEKYTAKEA